MKHCLRLSLSLLRMRVAGYHCTDESSRHKERSMEWQVQIWGDDEWCGWAHTDYDVHDKADADRAAKIARQYGWKVRVVQVQSDE